MPISVVLLSAGLDSTVNFKCAFDHGGVAAALTFDYGQRAAKREIQCAQAICKRYGVRHEVIPLPWFPRITKTALTDRSRKMPHPRAADLDKLSVTSKTAAKVWVPNRNGLLLAAAATFAEALRADQIVTGFNAEEAATFPDNSEEFMAAYTKTLRYSTRNAPRVKSYTIRLLKPVIVSLGMVLHAPLDLVWCCYEGGPRLCGRCESCHRFLRAIKRSGAEKWFRLNHPYMPGTGRRKEDDGRRTTDGGRKTVDHVG